jgi:type III restriction enzyme
MKLQFDANQEYQQQAIQSVVTLFTGQPLADSGISFDLDKVSGSLELNEYGFGNRLTLDDEALLENLRQVQEANGIPPASALEGRHFSLEMETGTGKTYVYLRTIYELNRQYGLKKFVVVVPSIAIREGVLKNLEITHEHLQNLYGHPPINFAVYDSGRVSLVRGFASANTIQILVLNIDAFAKDENIINKPNDKLSGHKPIEFIQHCRPVAIIDEPQNMETDIRRQAIANLNPCCTLRYSATHVNLYNLIYRLDPVRAYDLGLVKQIEVDSVFAENDHNQAFVSVEGFKQQKTKLSVRLTIDVNDAEAVKRKTVTAKVGDNLYDLSGQREIYSQGFILNSIDAGEGFVTFSNGRTVYMGEAQPGLADELMKAQIRKTVERHFAKEKRLQPRGVKVLTLFFIDRVANYRNYSGTGQTTKGKIAAWFEEIYTETQNKPAYRDLLPFPAEAVHNGYFAQDKQGAYKDSSEGRETQADTDTYQLIMKDKERLLSPEEPLRFIFSHSALREGWDNPNVFQICTLNEVRSIIKKRQEIGRGLRLAVDSTGSRVYDKEVNVLSVVANEGFADFAKQLQKEIQEDCGVNFAGRIKNATTRQTVHFRKQLALDPAFVDLWNKIKQKTIYRVRYDTEELIRQAAKAVQKMPPIPPLYIRSETVSVKMTTNGITGETHGQGADRVAVKATYIPDLLGYIQGKTELSKGTIARILKDSGRLGEVFTNPQAFLDLAVKEIQHSLMRLMVDGIKYRRLDGQEYSMELFEGKEIEAYIDNLYKVNRQDKTVSDYIIIDSNSQPERDFAKACEDSDQVKFFIKLPSWFRIATPLGSYNPDWALIFEGDRRLYFVAETKSTLDKYDLRPEEALKIDCGAAHFREFPEVVYKAPVKKLTDVLT